MLDPEVREVFQNPLLKRCLSSSFARWQTAISVVFQEALVRGDLPQSTDPDALSRFVLNSWQEALLRTQADRSDVPMLDFMRYIFEGCLNLKQRV